jgi:hypothetical protein
LATVGRAKSRKVSKAYEKILAQTVYNVASSTGVSIVDDRFLYAPIISHIDQLALDKGIITIQANGNIRSSNCEPLFFVDLNTQELFQEAA